MAKTGWSPDQVIDSSPEEVSISSGVPSPPADKRPRHGDAPAMAVVFNITPNAPRRRTAVSVASSSAASLAVEEARLELAEAERQ